MADTLIDWADVVWNPITGCSKISPGCDHCYAERMAKRLAGRGGYCIDQPFKVTYHNGDKLYLPMSWKFPRRVFVNSMGDLFHDDVKDTWIDDVLEIIIGHPQHTFMVLTKRPARMRRFMNRLYKEGWISVTGGFPVSQHEPIPNLQLGVTVEGPDQMWRVGELLATRSALRFVSAEPLLGLLDLSVAKLPSGATCHPLKVEEGHYPRSGWVGPLGWVIAGGETGPGARPMHPDWVRSVRDQAVAAGTPFSFKQWGEWLPTGQVNPEGKSNDPGWYVGKYSHRWEDGTGKTFPTHSIRVGKRPAGHLLDGVEWHQFPEVARG
jgi:protein gp37